MAEKVVIRRPATHYTCPRCHKELLSSSTDVVKSGLVIKSRLVFLTGGGEVMARCRGCRAVVRLPLTFDGSRNGVAEETAETGQIGI